jgi:hypothetical protein
MEPSHQMQKRKGPRRNKRPDPNRPTVISRVVYISDDTYVRQLFTFNTVYAAVLGNAVAQAISFTTATVQTGYGGWAAQVSTLYNEYRVRSIQLRIVPVPSVANAGLYVSGLYLTTFEGPQVPAQTIASISKLATHTLRPLYDKVFTVKWHMKDDPEDKTFVSTAVAAPIVGGIIGYVGAAAPTANVTYMTIEARYLVESRGRLI